MLIPLDTELIRTLTDGKTETGTQVAFPEGSAYQKLISYTESNKHLYTYNIYSSAGMPGTNITIKASYTEDKTKVINK